MFTAGRWWLIPVILDTQEEEIKRIFHHTARHEESAKYRMKYRSHLHEINKRPRTFLRSSRQKFHNAFFIRKCFPSKKNPEMLWCEHLLESF
jgi:hypothetical protein